MEQRWLSKTGICTVLGISEETLRTYVKKKYLVRIGAGPNIRYLDPTPEYKERLRIGEVIQSKHTNQAIDIDLTRMISIREISELTGWRFAYANTYMNRHKVPHVKVGDKQGNMYRLYAIQDVRRILWERRDRKAMAHQRSPFLLKELIEFFWKNYKRDSEEAPTDTEFKEDDLLQRKINRAMRYKSPQREQALADLMDKAKVARKTVSVLKRAERKGILSPGESDIHQ